MLPDSGWSRWARRIRAFARPTRWSSRREQSPAIVAGDADLEDAPRLGRARKLDREKLFGAAGVVGFHQHATLRPDLAVEVPRKREKSLLAQAPGPLLDGGDCDLRHARRRRPGPRRERKHMEVSEPALLDEIERAPKHRFGLGREAGDDVGPEHDVGPQRAQLGAQRDRIAARMAALHAL